MKVINKIKLIVALKKSIINKERINMNFEEKLINLVRENELLFNLKSMHYKNVFKKDKIWDEIAKNLNSNGKYYLLLL